MTLCRVVDSHGNDPLTVLNLISPTDAMQPISPLKKDQRGRTAIQQQARLAIGLHRHRYHRLIPVLASPAA